MNQDQMNITSISEVGSSRSSSVNAIVFPNDHENLDQIFDHLCDEIRSLCEEIQNNVRQYRTTNLGLNPEKTVVLKDMLTLLENKTNIINKLTTLFKDTKLTDFPHYRGEATLSIVEMLKNEHLSCEKSVEILERVKQENEIYLKCLKESEQFYNEMDEANEITLESNISDELLAKITTAVTKDYKDCKNDMKNLLDTLYPDSNFMDVLAELFQQSSTECNDEWYNITDSTAHTVFNLLIKCGMVIRNPANKNQVKLIL